MRVDRDKFALGRQDVEEVVGRECGLPNLFSPGRARFDAKVRWSAGPLVRWSVQPDVCHSDVLS